MGRPTATSWSRRGRWLTVAILWGCFGGRRGPGAARADDEPAAAAPSTAEPLLLQWYDVGALTAFRTDFWQEVSEIEDPFPAPPHLLGGIPLLSEQGEETTRPFGSIADLIEHVHSVTPPDAWKRDHVLLEELEGTRRLIVYAPRTLLDRVEAVLLDLEADAMRTVTFDAVVVRGDPTTTPSSPGRPYGLSERGLEPLVGVRTTGMLGQVVMGRTGGEQAHLADRNVEVAIDAGGSDPEVAVLGSGLSVRIKASHTTSTRVRGMLRAWWAAPAHLSTHRGAQGEIVERADVEQRSWSVGLDLEPGVWTVLPSTGGISLAVRATVETRPRGSPGPAPLVPAPLHSHRGPGRSRRWGVGDLSEHLVDAKGSIDLRVVSSSANTPPEPPELGERGAFPRHTLVDTLHLVIDPAAFIEDLATLDIRNDTLWGRLDDDSARIVDATLAAIRQRFLGTIDLRGTVISLPLAAFPELLSGLDDEAALVAGAGDALLRRPGARVLDRCALRLRPEQRGAVVGGRRHSYVADFDLVIAEKSLIGKPIQRAWLEGLSLDVRAHRSLSGDAVWCEIHVQRSAHRETRSVPTAHGPIDCPSIGVQRVSGAFALPVGGSRIVAAHLEGGVVTLVILGVAAP